MEDPAADAFGVQLLRKGFVEGGDAAHVVVDHADIDPGGNLAAENVVDAVPEFSFFNDKIFEENVPFGRFEGGQQGVEHGLAGRIIGSRRIAVRRTEGGTADISGLTRGSGVAFGKRVQHVAARFGSGAGNGGDGAHFLPACLGEMVPAENEVDGTSEKRKKENHDDPRQFVRHIPAGIDDPQDEAEFDQGSKGEIEGEVFVKLEDGGENKEKLDKDHQSDDIEPVEPAEFLEFA